MSNSVNVRFKKSACCRVEPLERRDLLAFTPFAYMWTEDPSSTTPIESYVHAESESDSTTTSRKLGTGSYEVRISRYAGFDREPVGMHVTAYGESNAFCKVTDFGSAADGSEDFVSRVGCYNSSGGRTDSRFTAAVINSFDIMLSAFANQASSSSYGVSTNRDTQVDVTRTSVGFYQLTFRDTNAADLPSNVQVTSVGNDANRCNVAGWVAGVDTNVWVTCVDPSGDRQDSKFTASIFRTPHSLSKFGFAWTQSTNDNEITDARFSLNPADNEITKTKIGRGRYQVDFVGMNRFPVAGGHIQVSAYGNAENHCKVVHWDSSSPDMSTIVSCFNSLGQASDASFSILAVPSFGRKPDKLEPNDSIDAASLLYDDAFEAELTIDLPEDEDYFKWMNLSGDGVVRFRILDFAHQGAGDLSFEVTAPNGTIYRSEDDALPLTTEVGDVFTIRVFSEEGFVNKQSYFEVDVPPPESTRDKDLSVSYSLVSAGPVSARPFWSHNQSNDEVTAERVGTGRYQLTFESLAPLLGNGGNVQVEGEHGDEYCKPTGWFDDESDLTVNVSCFDFGGNPADSSFRAIVIPQDNDLNFVYAWSNRLAGTSATPPLYTHNPMGGVSVDRTDAGRYAVRFSGLGDPRGDGNVQVTAYGDDNRRCNVSSWDSIGDDFVANVLCMEATGRAADSRFSIAAIPPNVETDVIYAASIQPERSEWPLEDYLVHSSDGATISKSYQSTGRYRLQTSSSSDQFGRGFAMTTALGTTANCSANTVYFDAQGMTCFIRSDRRIDSGFSMIVLPSPSDAVAFDSTNDGALDETDINALCAAIHSFPSDIFDYNGDGMIDRQDLVSLVRDGLGTHFGDANLDGSFNSTDLIRVFAAGEYEDGIAGNSTWSEGDWNCDGEFDTSDLIWAFADGGYELAAKKTTQDFRPVANLNHKLTDLAMAMLWDDAKDR